MTRLVVDSSVVIKWSVPEVHSAGALRYLDPDSERDAPELLLAEISNILWKTVGRKELTREQAARIAADVGQADVTVHTMGPMFARALQIALESGHSAYDSVYLALAEALSTRVVTADRRLCNALQSGPFAGSFSGSRTGREHQSAPVRTLMAKTEIISASVKPAISNPAPSLVDHSIHNVGASVCVMVLDQGACGEETSRHQKRSALSSSMTTRAMESLISEVLTRTASNVMVSSVSFSYAAIAR